jgi:hypothetical protein
MSPKIYHALLLLPLLLLLSTCQSLADLYAAGDYDKSFKGALRQLTYKPQDDNALIILEQSLEQLITAQQSEFSNFQKMDDPENWEKALDVVAKMDALLAEAQPYLSEPFAAEQAVWWADALVLEEQLYFHYLDRGKSRLAQSLADKNARIGRLAYYDFSSAIHYQQTGFPEREQLESYRMEAEKAGTIHYTVEIDDGFNIGLLRVDVEGEFRGLAQRGNQFLQITKEFIANSGDCAISIDFDEFETIVEERENREEFRVSVITDYEAQTDTLGKVTEIPIYADVTAWVETVTSTKTGEWSVDVDVNRRTKNCTIFGKDYTRRVTSEIEYFRTGGDERAIPDRCKRIGSRDEHPDDEDMAKELLEELVELIYRDYFN